MVYLIDAVRSPFAPALGALKNWHPVSLLAATLEAVVERVDEPIERVVASCLSPIGDQALNVGRNAALAARWDESVFATTADGVGVGAFIDAYSAVASGQQRVVVACGVESASRVPDGATSGVAVGKPFGPLVHQRYETSGGLLSPGMVAEALATRWHLSRNDLDAYAASSVQRFSSACETGVFKAQIHPVASKNDRGTDTASSIVEDVIGVWQSVESYQPLFEIDGKLTARTFAHPGDGATAMVLASQPRPGALARIVAVSAFGSDVLGGSSGRHAVEAVMASASVDVVDIDRVDVHEDSAVTALALMADLELDGDVVNCDGGALACAAPAGAAALTTVLTTAHGLVRDQQRFGLAVVAGTTGNVFAVLLENAQQ